MANAIAPDWALFSPDGLARWLKSQGMSYTDAKRIAHDDDVMHAIEARDYAATAGIVNQKLVLAKHSVQITAVQKGGSKATPVKTYTAVTKDEGGKKTTTAVEKKGDGSLITVTMSDGTEVPMPATKDKDGGFSIDVASLYAAQAGSTDAQVAFAGSNASMGQLLAHPNAKVKMGDLLPGRRTDTHREELGSPWNGRRFGRQLFGKADHDISTAIKYLHQLSPGEVYSLQLRFLKAGLFPAEVIRSGRFLAGDSTDPSTMAAWNQLIALQQTDPRRTMADILDDREKLFAEDLAKLRSPHAPVNLHKTVTTVNPDSVRLGIREAYQQTLGRDPTEAEMTNLLNITLSKDRAAAVGQAHAEMNAQRANMAAQDPVGAIPGMPGSAGDDFLGQFLDAITVRESGGNYNARSPAGAFGRYQFMPGTWDAVARRNGLNPNDRSPANQDRVARAHAAELARSFGGDPWLMAVAWHAGSGTAARAMKHGRAAISGIRDGSFRHVRTVEYADHVVSMLGRGGGALFAAASAQPTGANNVTAVENFDPIAYVNEEARRRNPVEHGAVKLGTAFDAFRDLIGGTA